MVYVRGTTISENVEEDYCVVPSCVTYSDHALRVYTPRDDYSANERSRSSNAYESSVGLLERALIFLRLRRSLRDLFFFHFSLIFWILKSKQSIGQCEIDTDLL